LTDLRSHAIFFHMNNDTIRLAVLEAVEASLSAQIKAIRLLRTKKPSSQTRDAEPGSPAHIKSRSHIDMTYDILAEATRPLHITDIISLIAARFDTRVDRESLVSALSKRVVRQDRFVRTDKNTFALISARNPKASRS